MSAKLLVVDDESDVREFVANFFRKRKVAVFTAQDGEEAIKTLVSSQPEIVLLDINMKGMDGIEALRRIRELNNLTKVIMLTGRDDEGALQRTRELGAYGYIHKPLKLEELEEVVMKLLR